jgi:hypothetical protein
MVEVEIIPLQAQQLPQSHSSRDRQDVQGMEAVIGRAGQKCVDLVPIQRLELWPFGSWRVDRVARVTRQRTHLDRLIQRAAQDGVRVDDGTCGQSFGGEVAVQRLDGRRRHLRQPELAQARRDAMLNDADIPGVGLVAATRLDRRFEPAAQIGGERRVALGQFVAFLGLPLELPNLAARCIGRLAIANNLLDAPQRIPHAQRGNP